MLSDREREQLAGIERALVAEDRRLAATLGTAAPARERRWLPRALLGFGVFLLVVAVLTGADGLFLQGVLCVAGAYVWRRWRTARARAAARGPVADPPRGAKPGGSPPGWFRPV
jgi:hypothetical protein